MPKTRTDILVEDLIAQHAPPGMIQHARAGHSTDYASPLAAPIAQLVDDAMRLDLHLIAQWAMAGKYDGTREEADAWFPRDGTGRR